MGTRQRSTQVQEKHNVKGNPKMRTEKKESQSMRDKPRKHNDMIWTYREISKTLQENFTSRMKMRSTPLMTMMYTFQKGFHLSQTDPKPFQKSVKYVLSPVIY